MSTIHSQADIERFRLKTIEVGLSLEAKGMRHSHNAVATAARQILSDHGIKPARSKAKLYKQFVEYRKADKMMDDLPSTPNPTTTRYFDEGGNEKHNRPQ